MASAADNRRGILAMLTAMAVFCVSDTLLKVASSSLNTGSLMAARGLLAIVLSLTLVAAMGHLRALPRALDRRVLARGVIETIVSGTFFAALPHLSLATITAILQSTPIIITLIIAAVGLEKVGWRRWASIVVGFAGVLLIVRPDWQGIDRATLLALICATLVAVRDLVTRSIPAEIPSVIATLVTTTAVTIAGFGLSLLEPQGFMWAAIGAREAWLLAASAVLVTLGNLTVIMAFRGTDVSVVSPFRYSVILWAVILGFVVFGDWPDLATFAGTGLIVGAGLYALHRERVRNARPAAIADAPGATRPQG